METREIERNSFTITPNDHLAIPAISFAPKGKEMDSVVFLLHGFSVCKETQIPDLRSLAENGFHAISIDAPHHGNRDSGLLNIMQGLSKRDSYLLVLSIIQQQASEIAAVTRLYKEKKNKKVAIAGISMGGFTAFASLLNEVKPDLIMPFLGTPDWRQKNEEKHFGYSILEKSGPIDSVEELPCIPIFMVNAGKDKIVSASKTRNFYYKLKENYQNNPESLKYLEYPESAHMMRPSDWYEAWDKAMAFLSNNGF